MTSSHWLSVWKGIIYVGLFGLLLTPFVVTNSLYFPFITGKAFFFRTIVEIIFGAWLILAIASPEYRPRRSCIIGSLLFFLFTIFISNWFGINPTASFWSNLERMEGYVTLVHVGALVLVLGSFFKTARQWNIYVHTMVISSLFMVFSAFQQIAEFGFEFRIDTTLGNPIYLAVYMLFNSFLIIWLIARLQKSTIRGYVTSALFWTYTLMWILHIIILVQTQTRGAMIGMFVGLLVTFVITALFAKNEKPVRIISSVVLAVLLLCAAGIYAGRNSDFIKNTPGLNRLTTISASEGTGQARLWNWGIAWQGVKERPLFGWGQSNYNFVFDKYYDPRMYEQESWFDRTHNIILDWLIAGGFIGLFGYLAIILSVMWLIWRRMDTTVFEKSILTGLLIAYFVHNLFVFDHTVSYLLFAIVVAYVYSQTASAPVFSERPLFAGKELFFITLIIVATLLTVFYTNRSGYVAARDLVSAIQIFRQVDGKLMYAHDNGLEDNFKMYQSILSRDSYANPEVRSRLISAAGEVSRIQNLPEPIVAMFIKFATEQMQGQITETADARYPYLLSSLYAQTGLYSQAVDALQNAISLSPRKQAFHFMLARIYFSMNNKEAAIASAKYAYELAPQFDRAWVEYANILGASDSKLFEKEITEQVSLENFRRVEMVILENIRKNPNLLSTRVSLSALYFQMNEKEKALTVLREAIEKFPAAKVQLDKLKTQIENGVNPIGQTF